MHKVNDNTAKVDTVHISQILNKVGPQWQSTGSRGSLWFKSWEGVKYYPPPPFLPMPPGGSSSIVMSLVLIFSYLYEYLSSALSRDEP